MNHGEFGRAHQLVAAVHRDAVGTFTEVAAEPALAAPVSPSGTK